MSVELQIQLSEEARAALKAVESIPAELLAALAKELDAQNQLTVGHIQMAYLQFSSAEPPVAIGLRKITNRLRSSIRASNARVVGDRLESGIGSNVVYAEIHELGGTIPAHVIKPKDAKALRFTIGERVIFAHEVKIPEVNMPARAPIQNGIGDRLDDYGEAFSDITVKMLSA